MCILRVFARAHLSHTPARRDRRYGERTREGAQKYAPSVFRFGNLYRCARGVNISSRWKRFPKVLHEDEQFREIRIPCQRSSRGMHITRTRRTLDATRQNYMESFELVK